MKTSLFLRLLPGAPLMLVQLAGQTPLQDTRSLMDKWTDTQEIISSEKSDWRVEESILRDTRLLLSNELARLKRTIQELGESVTEADEERVRLTAEKEQLLSASTVVGSEVAELETRIKNMIQTFPAPLVEKIKPLIRRLPQDPANTESSLGERVQNVVGILGQADKFNSSLLSTSESREVSGGKLIEVRTLYWGLAMAYFVDTSGNFAGIGFPGKRGWEWSEIAGAGPSIKQLLAVYEGASDIQFVDAPARIN